MIRIDPKAGTVEVVGEDGATRRYPIGAPEAFKIISRAWLRSGWDSKYVYSFTWLGRPIIQLPEDLLRIQEVICTVRPDVIVETGVAHGGSLVFYASLCQALGKGRVVGIDVEIRPHNRAAIEAHPLFDWITLVEGSSTDSNVIAHVRGLLKPGESALVLLDSCHARDHVLAELEAYAPLVGVGSYIVAMDGIMADVVGAPRTQPDWTWNNPCEAVRRFLEHHPEFVAQEPAFLFNEGNVTERVTYWPGAYLKRLA